MIGIPQPSFEMQPGDQTIEVGGHKIVINPGSGVFDLEPPQPWTAEQQRLHEEMMAGHFDLATCWDASGGYIGQPSKFESATTPSDPLRLITEHHKPSSDK